MFKVLHWAAALSIVAAPIARPLAAIEPEQGCFMKTASGQLVSLGHLCSSPTAAPRRLQTPTRPVRRPSAAPADRYSNAATSARLVKEGRGGYFDTASKIDHDYYYQIWSAPGSNSVELRVWRYQDYAHGSPLLTSGSFSTAVDAEHYFACRFAHQPTVACPLLTPRSPQ